MEKITRLVEELDKQKALVAYYKGLYEGLKSLNQKKHH